MQHFYEKQETSDAFDRWNNIEELIVSIEEYEVNKKNHSLVEYLEEVSLLTDIDRWNKNENAVTLMTIHSSKGLEFDSVFIIGLEDGLFPIIRDFEQNDIEEERRLFYVALTRSRKNIILSYAKARRKFGNNLIVCFKSRFLNEIPKELVVFNSSLKRKIFDSAVLKEKNKNLNEIYIGSNVEHKVFGKGKVINIEGIGTNAKITATFRNNVTKKLIFKYANLKIIN